MLTCKLFQNFVVLARIFRFWNYSLSVSSLLLNSSRVLIAGISFLMCSASNVSNLMLLDAWSIIFQLNSDLLEFLRFRVPENGVFSNQAIHSFQTKLLRTEINKARTVEKNVEVKLERARGAVQRGVDEKFWPSVIKYLSLRGQRQTSNYQKGKTDL